MPKRKTLQIDSKIHRNLAIIAGGRGTTIGKLAEAILLSYVLQSAQPKLKTLKRKEK